jgi:hypothetical protein
MRFIRDQGAERFAETILAKDADGEGRGVVTGVGRPTDKLFKVIEISGFDVGRSGDHGRLSRAEKGDIEGQQEAAEREDAAWTHRWRITPLEARSHGRATRKNGRKNGRKNAGNDAGNNALKTRRATGNTRTMGVLQNCDLPGDAELKLTYSMLSGFRQLPADLDFFIASHGELAQRGEQEAQAG